MDSRSLDTLHAATDLPDVKSARGRINEYAGISKLDPFDVVGR